MKAPVYDRYGIAVYHGDNLDVMRRMADASVHSIVTDPPAGIRFMNRAWDSDMGGRHSWVAWLSERMTEAHRVLKPGGYGLVWAMPRTSHWTAWALEDAGFEIRDCVVHLFGAGFPKSLDVSKAIDKTRNDRQDVLAVTSWLADQAEARGFGRRELDVHMGTSDMGGWWLSRLEHRCACPTWEQWDQLKRFIGLPDDMDAEVWRLNGRKGSPGEAWSQREITQAEKRSLAPGAVISFDQRSSSERERRDIPATDAAREWLGFGTALKPAAEHWWLIRKPMPGTVAQNVQEHGVGALNIGACRVAHGADVDLAHRQRQQQGEDNGWRMARNLKGTDIATYKPGGRWPSNAVLTHSDCANGCDESCPVAELDTQSGVSASTDRPRNNTAAAHNNTASMGKSSADWTTGGHNDSGGASRFFPAFHWEAKAPTSERPKVDGKAHPTVKPLDLMRWMVRLVTPPGGTVLDLFAGTGTTGHAARAEGMRGVLIEQDADHIPLIVSRLDGYRAPAVVDQETGEAEPMDLLDLLGEVAS